jgi:hypothetical protein
LSCQELLDAGQRTWGEGCVCLVKELLDAGQRTWDEGLESTLNFVVDAVAGLVGIEGGVVSGVINLESSGVEAPDWRPRHDEHYHEA